MRASCLIEMEPADLTRKYLEKTATWLQVYKPELNAAYSGDEIGFDTEGDPRFIQALIGHLVLKFAAEEGVLPRI